MKEFDNLRPLKKSTWHPSVMMPLETQSVLRRVCLALWKGALLRQCCLSAAQIRTQNQDMTRRRDSRQAPLSTPGPSLLTLYLWTQARILDV